MVLLAAAGEAVRGLGGAKSATPSLQNDRYRTQLAVRNSYPHPEMLAWANNTSRLSVQGSALKAAASLASRQPVVLDVWENNQLGGMGMAWYAGEYWWNPEEGRQRDLWLQVFQPKNPPACVWRDLRRYEREDAWKLIQKEGLRDFLLELSNPRAALLWIRAGRDPNGRDCAGGSGRPPHVMSVALLKPLGFCDAREADDIPVLRAAIGSPESLWLLIAAGADVNVVPWEGMPPLTAAVPAKDVDSVAVLLDGGADPWLRGRRGDRESAMDILQSSVADSSFDDIREMLRKRAVR